MLADFEKAKAEDKTELNQEIKKLRAQLVAQQQQVRVHLAPTIAENRVLPKLLREQLFPTTSLPNRFWGKLLIRQQHIVDIVRARQRLSDNIVGAIQRRIYDDFFLSYIQFFSIASLLPIQRKILLRPQDRISLSSQRSDQSAQSLLNPPRSANFP